MGMIQQNINQGLSIASFLFSQTDTAKNLQRKHQLEKELKTEWKAREVRQETKGAKTYDPEQTGNLLKKERELYTLNPTQERLKSVLATEDIHYNEVKDYEKEQKEIAEIEAEPARKEAEEEALYQQQAEEDAAELARREQSAAASETIRARILDPRTIADEELQKAIEIKKETNRRKGGITL